MSEVLHDADATLGLLSCSWSNSLVGPSNTTLFTMGFEFEIFASTERDDKETTDGHCELCATS